MTINGYSERGIMNALFYGMAYKGDDSHVREFLRVAKIADFENYSNFNIIMEGSLSDFGDPDAIIIAKDQKTVFFVEAKVSSGKVYSLIVERDKFNKALNNRNYYDASNLFYQLSLKELFFKVCKSQDISGIDNYIKKRKDATTERTTGESNIVFKIIELIKACDKAEFIAITPDDNKEFKFGDFHFVTWNAIAEEPDLNQFIRDTLEFNQAVDVVFDIINNKRQKRPIQ